NVDDKDVEGEVTEHLSAFMGVFTNADPFRKYENARPLDAGIIPDRKSLAFISVVFVFDDARLEHYRLPISELSNTRAPRQLITALPHRFGDVRVATLALLTRTALS